MMISEYTLWSISALTFPFSRFECLSLGRYSLLQFTTVKRKPHRVSPGVIIKHSGMELILYILVILTVIFPVLRRSHAGLSHITAALLLTFAS